MAAKSVAIIGAGPSGLASAKAVLDIGLVPRVFEAASSVGGLWSPESKLCRPSMRTNLSKHTNCFSDLAWPEDAPTFPAAAQVGQYLSAYAQKFIPEGIVSFNCNVTHVERSQSNNKWTITWDTDGKESCEEFDFMIVACGFFSEPFIPEIPGLETFKGTIIHSSEYTCPETYKDKHVAIIGGSLSSVEVVEDIAPYAASIHQIIPRPFWVIPKYLSLDPEDPSTAFLPLDLVLYRRFPPPSEGANTSLQTRWRKVNENLKSLCGGLGDITEGMKVDLDMPPYAAVSNMYANYVRSGRVILYTGHLISASGSTLNINPLSNRPPPDEISHIIFATGFRPSSSSHIFSPEILSELNFSGKDHFLPVLLHRATLHPSLPNAAFVGHYRGPYWGVIELQARWCAGLFSGALPWPSQAEMEEGIAAEKKMREMRPRMQWPRGDYVNFGSDLAEILGLALPPLNPKMRERSLTTNDVFVPAHFAQPTWLQSRSHDSAIPALIDSLSNTLIQSANSGLFVAAAIFRSLHGHWSLSRFYASRRPEYPSGPSVGTAEFIPRKASPKSSSPSTAKIEYLYSEKTTLTTSSGLQLQGTQQYIYTYDESDDKIEVFFAKRDEGFALDYLFHQVHLLAKVEPAGARSPWQATSSHFCTPDNYKVAYEFYFKGSDLERWKIEYDVNGPKKDYTMQTWYTRPQNLQSLL